MSEPKASLPLPQMTEPAAQAPESSPISRVGAQANPGGPLRPRIAWSTALPKAAIAGFLTVMLLLGLLSIAQSALFVFLVLPLGGIFSMWLYARGRDPGQMVTGTGVRIGAVTGLFTFVIYGIIVAAQFTAQKGMARETMQKAMEQALARNPNPQAQALMNQIMTPEGIATLLTITAVVFLFVFLIFGAIGGSLGAVILRNRQGTSN